MSRFFARPVAAFGNQESPRVTDPDDADATIVGLCKAIFDALGDGFVHTVTYVDRSNTVASGGTWQQLAPANTTRGGVWVQNKSTGVLSLRFSDADASGSELEIDPRGYWASEPNGAPNGKISIKGDTTGQQFSAREW